MTFVGSALDDLRRFPDSARRRAGVQIDRVQRGLEPDDWKPMTTIGPGVREIRVRDGAGAFRIVYVANLADTIDVLHAFAKGSQRTSKHDLDLLALHGRFDGLPRSRTVQPSLRGAKRRGNPVCGFR